MIIRIQTKENLLVDFLVTEILDHAHFRLKKRYLSLKSCLMKSLCEAQWQESYIRNLGRSGKSDSYTLTNMRAAIGQRLHSSQFRKSQIFIKKLLRRITFKNNRKGFFVLKRTHLVDELRPAFIDRLIKSKDFLCLYDNSKLHSLDFYTSCSMKGVIKWNN